MTREEAKKRLEVWLKCGECPEDKRCYDSYLHSTCEYTDYCDEVSIGEAIKVAIEILKQEPCEDCISRQAVLDSIHANCVYENEYNLTAKHIEDAVKQLPSVNPQKPKTGHWIVNEWGNISCSECGCTALYDKVYPGESVFGKAIRIKTTFCPTCGAKMVEPQERSDKE